ncbi:MAG TPA: homoserine kinase [Oscillatoriales cyanobacterium M59_W2019_021]|nr:MAG: homoserine kinase [Cyanobacteria bacterium J055]HIK30267.1 homoserine kinase [Oscillatoriales cyanobacterium M4454_W2019_049]HIK53412.1 homoserine kinase [Oscillatoriales cyanobacterium M59_W2019_021]
MNQDCVFPVIYSTLSPQAIVSELLPEYGIGNVTGCKFWRRGLSDVYLVETLTSPYILRVSHHHWRSRSEIEFELELLDFWRQRGLPVAHPLSTQSGDLSVEIAAPEGKRYAALFPYAPGEVAVGDLNPTQSWRLGETLAKLHQTALAFCPTAERHPLDLDYLLKESFAAIAPFLKHRPQDLDELSGIVDRVEAQLQHLPQEPPFWVVCWGDPHSGNAHFTPDNSVTLFDFDQCGYGWRAFDIAKFLQISLRTGIGKPVREAFLAGYQSVEELSEWELNALQALTQTAHIWMWAIDLHTSCFCNWCRLDDHYFIQRLGQLKRLNSHDWQLF